MTVPVWTFWDKPDLPPFVKLCKESWNYHLKCDSYKEGDTDKWKLTILNEEKLRKLVPPSYIPHNFDLLTPQRQANCARLAVLRKFGGVWIDACVILCDDFRWIERHLEKYSFVAFCCYGHGNGTNAVIDNWFFAARKGDQLIEKTHKIWVDVTANELVKGELPLTSKYSKNTTFYGLPNWDRKNHYMHVIMMYLRQFDVSIMRDFLGGRVQLYPADKNNGPLQLPLDWIRNGDKQIPNKSKFIKFCGWMKPAMDKAGKGIAAGWLEKLFCDNVPSFAMRRYWKNTMVESVISDESNKSHNHILKERLENSAQIKSGPFADIRSRSRIQNISVSAGCRKIPRVSVESSNSFVLKDNYGVEKYVVVIDGLVVKASDCFSPGDTVSNVRERYKELKTAWQESNSLASTICCEQLITKDPFAYSPLYQFHVFQGNIEVVEIHYNQFGPAVHSVAYVDASYKAHPKIKCMDVSLPKLGLQESIPNEWERMSSAALILARPFVYSQINLMLDDRANIYCDEIEICPRNGGNVFKPMTVDRIWAKLWSN